MLFMSKSSFQASYDSEREIWHNHVKFNTFLALVSPFRLSLFQYSVK